MTPEAAGGQSAQSALPLRQRHGIEPRSQVSSHGHNHDIIDEPMSPHSVTSSVVSLQELMYDARLTSIDEKEFIPADSIDTFTCRDMVKAVLEETEIEYGDELLSFACGEGKRTFLILVEIENLKALETLYASGFNDSHLPVRETKTTQEKRKGGRKKILYEIRSLDEVSSQLRPERWDVFTTDKWDNMSLMNFVQRQWLFLAPVFTKDKFLYVFHQTRPLPYVVEPGAQSKSGFFSRVSQVRIHDAHQRVIDDEKKPLVALKQLQPDKDTYFRREADTLNVIRDLSNTHLIKPIAAYQRGDSLCFMFPWAHGGNLREFWANADKGTAPRLKRDAELIQWSLEQMCGLAKGLEALHDKNCRHGDLKPENLLRFTEGGGRGILQIADVGLAKFHIVATQNRHVRTTTMTGTFRYEPPEADESLKDHPRSRDYDIWSLGCIYLEFLIWLLSGQEELEEFNSPGRFRHFWDLKDGRYQVHAEVQASIDDMSQRLGSDNPKADTALKSLLHLIKTRLLVARLRSDGDPAETARASAVELAEVMTAIYERAQRDSNYLFDGSLWRRRGRDTPASPNLEVPQRTDLPRHLNPSISFSPPTETLNKNENLSLLAPGPSPLATSNGNLKPASIAGSAEEDYNVPQLVKLNDDWESASDNHFARALFEKIDWPSVRPQIPVSELCENCKIMDIWSAGFKCSYSINGLKISAKDCDLCRLFYQVALEKQIEKQDYTDGTIEFHRIESAFKTPGSGLPVLSIYADPDSNSGPYHLAQLGFPLLPEQGSETQTAILKEWLRTCDETHGCLSMEDIHGENPLPTRVIDVGSAASPTLRLVDGGEKKFGKYIALSHCWGQVNDYRRLHTHKSNIDAFRKAIDFNRLPTTFQNAVRITRSLNIKYLWIDSLCIVQDDDDDWEAESGRMEYVFSLAYCTLAASSSKSSNEGFLVPREPRGCIKIALPGRGTFYVSKAIDNFHVDVEEGVLNQRGWVLQERALSRRSIHFTSSQVYWECGKGVHCETLTKLLNSKASFLGDSKFPKSALEYFKGGRILFFQNLYERYSRLKFTFYTDRPVAISGLEKRLVRTFETRGGYGVFESYLERGLLWQRPDNGSLTRIAYPPDRHVPSWSWMAYSGGIKYMDIPFDGAAWTKDLKTPFNAGTNDWNKRHWEPDQSTRSTDLMAYARQLKLTRVEMTRLVFDEPRDYDIATLKCVVVGKAKDDASAGDPIHWVLVIRPLVRKDTYALYERVGVGYLQSSQIDDETSLVRVR